MSRRDNVMKLLEQTTTLIRQGGSVVHRSGSCHGSKIESIFDKVGRLPYTEDSVRAFKEKARRQHRTVQWFAARFNSDFWRGFYVSIVVMSLLVVVRTVFGAFSLMMSIGFALGVVVFFFALFYLLELIYNTYGSRGWRSYRLRDYVSNNELDCLPGFVIETIVCFKKYSKGIPYDVKIHRLEGNDGFHPTFCLLAFLIEGREYYVCAWRHKKIVCLREKTLLARDIFSCKRKISKGKDDNEILF